MLRFIYLGTIALLLSVIPAACSSNAITTPTYPAYSFSSSGVFNINVAQIEFSEEYVSPYGPPNVEHTFPIKPAKAIVGLINDRFRPISTSGVLRVHIIDASVIEERLPQTEGIRGVFTNDQAARYKGSIKIILEIEEPGHYLPRATFTTYASRSDTVSEYISYYDRQKFFYDFTYQMLNQINDQISKNIPHDFQAYIQ